MQDDAPNGESQQATMCSKRGAASALESELGHTVANKI